MLNPCLIYVCHAFMADYFVKDNELKGLMVGRLNPPCSAVTIYLCFFVQGRDSWKPPFFLKNMFVDIVIAQVFCRQPFTENCLTA